MVWQVQVLWKLDVSCLPFHSFYLFILFFSLYFGLLFLTFSLSLSFLLHSLFLFFFFFLLIFLSLSRFFSFILNFSFRLSPVFALFNLPTQFQFHSISISTFDAWLQTLNSTTWPKYRPGIDFDNYIYYIWRWNTTTVNVFCSLQNSIEWNIRSS